MDEGLGISSQLTIMLFCRVNPKWVIFNSLVSTDRKYMRNVMTIDPSWLLEAAPDFYKLQQPNLLHWYDCLSLIN